MMEVPFVDLAAQYRAIKKQIDKAIEQTLSSTTFIGGEPVERFEKEFAAFSGHKYCVSCANGTDALEIALEALGIGPGDEVLVPAYTWVSTASAVSRVGARPVFVDVHPQYYTLDVQQIEPLLNKKTRAIIPVHLYGLPADMPAIMALAQKHNLLVIEDCAQAHGADIARQKTGTFGHIATYSFYPGKNLGAYGDAGAVVTSDKALADKCRLIARLGQRGKHNHLQIGRNSRLDSLQAAILSAKLPFLEEWTARRRWVARQYNLQLADLPIDRQQIPNDFKHVYHVYVIQTAERDRLQAYLAEAGIRTQIHYPKPLNQMTFFDTAAPRPVADKMAGRILSLPVYPELTKEQVAYVIDRIKYFFTYVV